MNNVKSLSENIAKAVSETTKHVEFLAAAYPEIRTNLQSISETLETVQSVVAGSLSDMQSTYAEKLSIEKQEKNRLYGFLLANGLLDAYKQFCAERRNITDWHGYCLAFFSDKDVIK